MAASYLLGHLLFLCSAKLDEWVYGPLRKLTAHGQRKALSKGDAIASAKARAWGRRLFGPDADAALERVLALKARALGPLQADKAINAYQWCKAHLTIHQPAAMVAVQRFEADSKFFRSLVVVLPMLALLYAVDLQWGRSVFCLAATVPAMWRYIDQRHKSTQQAYWSMLSLLASRTDGWPPVAVPTGNALTHAGGVVYRRQQTLQFMLIRSKGLTEEWLLPKGHIEPGENEAMAAVREVAEESGVWARIRSILGNQTITLPSGESLRVRWYLMEWTAASEDDSAIEGREVLFLAPEDAIDRATFTEAKSMLRDAAAALATGTDSDSAWSPGA